MPKPAITSSLAAMAGKAGNKAAAAALFKTARRVGSWFGASAQDKATM